jgi:hypothetical protein
MGRFFTAMGGEQYAERKTGLDADVGMLTRQRRGHRHFFSLPALAMKPPLASNVAEKINMMKPPTGDLIFSRERNMPRQSGGGRRRS